MWSVKADEYYLETLCQVRLKGFKEMEGSLSYCTFYTAVNIGMISRALIGQRLTHVVDVGNHSEEKEYREEGGKYM